jgi:hypothetical protein
MHKNNFVVTCISTQRAENVPHISKHFHMNDVVFFVSKGEAKSYKMYGAKEVIECERNICDARNKAFLYAKEKGLYCVQTSDDLKSISKVVDNKKVKCTTYEAIEDMILKMQETSAKLCGVSITDNILNYKKDWNTDKLIVNDLIIISPDNEILYDDGAFLKEDYDMYILQMQKYGIVLRADKYLCNFPHRQNKAGANTYRTYDTEKKQNEYVINKHRGLIVPHNRRDNQVSINYKLLYENISYTPNK